MKKNDGANDNERGRCLTRRAVLKASLALGALASTGSLASYAASPDSVPQNSPEKGKLVKTATWHDGFFFKDESLVFEILRVIAKAPEHGSDIGESLSTAFRIKQKEGDQQALLQAWYEEWRKLGERIEKIGDNCLAKGHKISARDAYLRASEYYRSADFYLHGNPDDQQVLRVTHLSVFCVIEAPCDNRHLINDYDIVMRNGVLGINIRGYTGIHKDNC